MNVRRSPKSVTRLRAPSRVEHPEIAGAAAVGDAGDLAVVGAERRDVYRLIVGQGMRLAAAGIAVGLALSASSASLVRSLLFGVSPWDPATFALVAALLAGIALLACWIPARRATRVDPMVSLRSE